MISATVTYTTGPSGTGKTLARCSVFLRKDFLPYRSGVHVSNFPIGVVPASHSVPPVHRWETFRHRIAMDVCGGDRRRARMMRRRMKVIPKDVLDSWRSGRSGPWEYFPADQSNAGSHFALDECHNFLGKKTPEKVIRQWQQFIGDLRHRGMTAEFLTQTGRKVAYDIPAEAGAKIVISDQMQERFFKVQFYDLYQLLAKLPFRRYVGISRIRYYKDDGEKFIPTFTHPLKLDPSHFAFYDSYSEPAQGGLSGKSEGHPCETMSVPKLLLWFLDRNMEVVALPILASIAIAAAVWNFAAIREAVPAGFDAVRAWVTPAAADPPAVEPRTIATLAAADASARAQAREPVAVPALSTGVVSAGAARSPEYRAEVAPPAEVLAPGMVAIDADELASLRRELSELREFQRRTLELASEAATLSLIGPDYAVFRDGSRYFLGDTIRWGIFRDLSLLSVDPRARTVRLSDGSELRLGVVGVRDANGAGDSGRPAP